MAGFTLVELLGVIVLLGIIGLITVPSISKVMKESKESLYLEQIRTLEIASEKWGIDNTGLLPKEENEVSSISLKELLESGHIKNKEIKDPRTGVELKGCIQVSYDETHKQYNYDYNETCDGSIPSLKGPIITVLGKTTNQTIGIEATDHYNVPVGTAVDYEGNPLAVLVSGNVTPSFPGIYKITYMATDIKGVTSKLILTIHVIDTENPTVDYTMYPSSASGENGWYHVSITIQLSGNDIGSGIAGYQYAINTGSAYNAWVNQSSSTFTLSTEGSTLQFKVRSKDAGGNYSEIKESQVIKLDLTKPMIDSVTMNQTGWTSGPVVVTVNGSDNLSGIGQYSFDEGLTWQKENTKQFTSNQTVYVLVKDQAGNTSISKSVTINNIENTKPTIEYAVVGTPFNSNGWANSNFNVNIIPHVGGSGLKSYRYCTTTGETCTPDITLTGMSQAVTISTESDTVKICGEAVNNANNTSGIVCSNIYKLDKTAPNFSNLTITKTASNYNNLDTTLGLTAADNSGIEMNISNSSYESGAWENYTASKAWNVGGSLNGTERTIFVQVRDLAGNTVSKAVSYIPYKECSVITDTNFGEWGSCSASCGGGTQTANGQKVDNYTKANCGTTTKTQSCNNQSCSLPPSEIITIGGGENLNGRYYFRGDNPNNWVRFNDELWRIVYIENGSAKIIRNDNLLSMSICNKPWSSSYGMNYLNTTYLNAINTLERSKLLNATWDVGELPTGVTSAFGIKSYEIAKSWTGYVGLPYASDFGYISLNSDCQTAATSSACSKNSWIWRAEGWTMTSYRNDNTSYYVVMSGGIYMYSCSVSYNLRPVVFLKPEVTFSGKGTQAEPFVVQ